jgi:protein-S-isoprenylcysteine O-methyltransferase Ste14
LAIYWVVFGLFHSVLATSAVKDFFKAILKNNFKFYRLGYSILAVVMVAFVLYFNFTITSLQLWHPSLLQKMIASVTGTTGLSIMCMCIYKYFFHLSGIDIFFKKKSEDHLQVGGLNKYVRHPLYSSTLLFAWSFFFWQPVLSNLISCFIITVYTIAGAYFEEKKLEKIFGEQYKQYVSKVPMIIPKII